MNSKYDYTILGKRIINEVDIINYRNADATKNLKYSNPEKYTIKDLADKSGIDFGNLSNYLTGRKTMPLKAVLKIIAVLRCDEETATSILHEAGYDISGNTIEFCCEYRAIIKNIQDPEWREAKEAEDIENKTGINVKNGFRLY